MIHFMESGSPISFTQYVSITKTNIQMMVKSILFRNQYYTYSDTHAYTRTRCICLCEGAFRERKIRRKKERKKHEINKHIRTHAFDFYRSKRKKIENRNKRSPKILRLLVIYLTEHCMNGCVRNHAYTHAHRVFHAERVMMCNSIDDDDEIFLLKKSVQKMPCHSRNHELNYQCFSIATK